MEGIADIYVIYFQASLFPLTLAPAPQQGQLTVSTSYMNVTLRHKSVDIFLTPWALKLQNNLLWMIS